MNYYLYINNEVKGPHTREQLMAMVAQGFQVETPCCREGEKEWSTVGHFLQAAQTAAPASFGGDSRFSHAQYLIRKKVFKLFGSSFHIYDPKGEVVFYANLKAFKLKEDIRIYSGEDMKTEVLSIKARKILDFSSAYDIVDSSTQVKVGVLKRKGLKSIIKDEWIFMDNGDQEIGLIKEDSLLMALIRRFVLDIFPQKFLGEIGGTPVCTFKQNFNPFVQKITLDFSGDTQNLLDRRLGIAAAILLVAIERRQD